jgi:hypothetical protein
MKFSTLHKHFHYDKESPLFTNTQGETLIDLIFYKTY